LRDGTGSENCLRECVDGQQVRQQKRDGSGQGVGQGQARGPRQGGNA
jgi:hypothetical protein